MRSLNLQGAGIEMNKKDGSTCRKTQVKTVDYPVVQGVTVDGGKTDSCCLKKKKKTDAVFSCYSENCI